MKNQGMLDGADQVGEGEGGLPLLPVFETLPCFWRDPELPPQVPGGRREGSLSVAASFWFLKYLINLVTP